MSLVFGYEWVVGVDSVGRIDRSGREEREAVTGVVRILFFKRFER